MAEELQIRTEARPGVTVLKVVGAVDHVQWFKLEEAIQTALDRKQVHLVVDLSELTYICSAGINTLGHAATQFQRIKGGFCLVKPAKIAQWHFFTTVGVDRIFPWAESLDEAVRRASAVQAPPSA